MRNTVSWDENMHSWKCMRKYNAVIMIQIWSNDNCELVEQVKMLQIGVLSFQNECTMPSEMWRAADNWLKSNVSAPFGLSGLAMSLADVAKESTTCWIGNISITGTTPSLRAELIAPSVRKIPCLARRQSNNAWSESLLCLNSQLSARGECFAPHLPFYFEKGSATSR